MWVIKVWYGDGERRRCVAVTRETLELSEVMCREESERCLTPSSCRMGNKQDKSTRPCSVLPDGPT